MMYRLLPVAGEWIDRSRPLDFEFEGAALRGFAGDTLTSALVAAGVMTLGRSFKYHRPRGLCSFANHDANAMFDVNGVPNVRGDVTPLEAGMRVAAVNTFGGLAHDRARFIERLAGFLPVGFYYKAFHGRGFPRWERRIRALSGLGRIDASAPRARTPKRYLFCDVLVIGAGPSGLSAALAAADAGLRVLLVDENARAGGSGAWTRGPAALAALLERVRRHAGIELLTGTCAAGYYADHWVALVERGRLGKVRAGAVVFATGLIEQPAVFRHNDAPGVLLGSAAQRLLHRHAIAPGKRVAVLTANAAGYALARALHGHGVGVGAVLDLRADSFGDAATLTGVRCLGGVAPIEALTNAEGCVSGLRVQVGSRSEILECDAVLMSTGYAPASQLLLQAGAVMAFDAQRQQHVPAQLPPGIFAAGSVNGVQEPEARLADGADAGAAAAAFARGVAHARAPRPAPQRPASHAWPIFPHPRGRDFVDLDEDIQVKDLLNSAQEGYDNIELLKRFSTLGMGPSQGKLSNLNGARILMQARGATLADTRLTTQRPFYHPVPLKHLAGAGFHAERRTGAHECHEELGAAWMTLGGWRRPEYYRRDGQSRAECIAAEVRAVRERAGLIDVSTLGKIELFGPDAGAFLDRVYAGSFSDLPVGRTRYAVMLDESGIVRDDGVVARLGPGHFYFTTTTGGAAAVYRDLLLWNTRWRMNLSLVNATGHRGALNLAGPASRDVLRDLVDIDVSEQALPHLGVRTATLDGVPVRILRAGFVSALGFEIHLRHSDVARVWRRLLAVDGVRAFGVEAQRVLRLEKGHAIVAQDTDSLTNPFEAGLGFAVRMSKPFFVGQRSLRIHQQRGARQQLVGFEIDEGQPAILECNLVIAGGAIAGRVTSIARSPTLGRVIGFAMTRPDLAVAGGTLEIRASDGRTARARVSRTPFVEAA